MSEPLTLDWLNALDESGFIAALEGVVEHSPWVVEEAARLRPFRGLDDLHAALMAVVGNAGPEQQLDLLRAHPDLAGRLAESGALTAESALEQASVGFDSLTAEDRARFRELNAAYREKFGFPFVIAARDHRRNEILDAFERRLANNPAAERTAALREVARIVRWRIEDRLAGDRFAALGTRVRRDLALVDYPRGDWVPPRRHPSGAPVYDVLIVGAGQGGLGTAFALQRMCVRNVLVVDRNPPGREGPWLTFARMLTLRTPKHITGPDLDIPSLTPQAWFRARYGDAAWDTLGLIPRQDWQAYLDWFREVVGIAVRNRTEVVAVAPDDPASADSLVGVDLAATADGGLSGRVYAREVVLATGMDGSGAWKVPAFIADALPADRYAHTADDIDFAALAGKRIAVLGAGASAFDNAATALETGAAEVRLFVRREAIQRVNPVRWMERTGFLRHFHEMDDATRWRMMRHVLRLNQPPPQDTWLRTSRHAGFFLHQGAGWRRVAMDGDEIAIETGRGGDFRVDFVIAGTGFVTDFALRRELAPFADEIALWRDRFMPPADAPSEGLAAHPYLGAGFEFTERRPGAAPWLKHLRLFTLATMASHGLSGSSISALKFAVPRLADRITAALWLGDATHHAESLLTYDTPELTAEITDADAEWAA